MYDKLIKKYYLMKFIFCWSIAIFSGFIYLFIANKNITHQKIGVLITIFYLSSLALEIPSGILSDIWGRKKIFLASTALRIGGLLLIAFGTKYGLLVLAFVIAGMADAFSSGLLESWIYDQVPKETIDKIAINSSNISTLVSMVGGLLGVKLYFYYSGTPILMISVLLLTINGCLAIYFIEPSVSFSKNFSVQSFQSLFATPLQQTKDLFLPQKGSDHTIFISLLAILAISISVIPGFYYQLMFSEFGPEKWPLVTLATLIPIAAFAGQSLYRKIRIDHNRRNLNTIFFFSGLSVIISALASNKVLALIFFLLHVTATAIVEVYIIIFINKKIVESRNTAISTIFFVQSLFASLLLSISSAILNYVSVAQMQIIITCALIFSYLIFSRFMQNNKSNINNQSNHG